MSQAKATESLANDCNESFKVGDGVHWGWNGDRYPGTVRKVSDSGRQVWVSSDDHKFTDEELAYRKEHGLHEGDSDCTFTSKDVPESEWTMFKLNKWGQFVMHGSRAHFLHLGRRYAQNPSL